MRVQLTPSMRVHEKWEFQEKKKSKYARTKDAVFFERENLDPYFLNNHFLWWRIRQCAKISTFSEKQMKSNPGIDNMLSKNTCTLS